MTDTKQRILDAAEALFGRDGYPATSLRAVTAEAGVNLASVNYHFGSKEALLRAVFDRLAQPVNAARLDALDHLEARDEPARLDEILDAFLEPALGIVTTLGSRGAAATRFLGRVAADSSPTMRDMVRKEFQDVSRRYVNALSLVLPHLKPWELMWRFKMMIGVLVYVQRNELWDGEGEVLLSSSELEGIRRQMVTFLAGGFTARPSGPIPSTT